MQILTQRVWWGFKPAGSQVMHSTCASLTADSRGFFSFSTGSSAEMGTQGLLETGVRVLAP